MAPATGMPRATSTPSACRPSSDDTSKTYIRQIPAAATMMASQVLPATGRRNTRPASSAVNTGARLCVMSTLATVVSDSENMKQVNITAHIRPLAHTVPPPERSWRSGERSPRTTNQTSTVRAANTLRQNVTSKPSVVWKKRLSTPPVLHMSAQATTQAMAWRSVMVDRGLNQVWGRPAWAGSAG